MSLLRPATAVRAVGCRCARKLWRQDRSERTPVQPEDVSAAYVQDLVEGDSDRKGSWSYPRISGSEGEMSRGALDERLAERRRAPWAPDMSPR